MQEEKKTKLIRVPFKTWHIIKVRAAQQDQEIGKYIEQLIALSKTSKKGE